MWDTLLCSCVQYMYCIHIIVLYDYCVTVAPTDTENIPTAVC